MRTIMGYRWSGATWVQRPERQGRPASGDPGGDGVLRRRPCGAGERRDDCDGGGVHDSVAGEAVVFPYLITEIKRVETARRQQVYMLWTPVTKVTDQAEREVCVGVRRRCRPLPPTCLLNKDRLGLLAQ